MSNKKRDLVIHYDEENQKIAFYSTDIANTEAIRANEFDGVCPEVVFFKNLRPESAEQKIGGLLFALLDLHSNQKISIRDYKLEAEKSTKQWEQDD